jgi:hypothetical protein
MLQEPMIAGTTFNTISSISHVIQGNRERSLRGTLPTFSIHFSFSSFESDLVSLLSGKLLSS